MAMKSLSELRNLFAEPQLLHKWQIEIPTWPTAVSPANTNLLFMITTADLPTIEYEDAVVELGGFKMTHNGKTNRNGEITFTFFETVQGDVMQYFFIDFANKRQEYIDNSGITMKSATSPELMVPIINMNLLAADASTLTKQIQLVNCLMEPSNFGGELGQDGSTVQKPTLLVKFDSFVYTKL